ncbi:hypothetical protein AAIH44_34385, partial [Pseudomonas aeruginosa]
MSGKPAARVTDPTTCPVPGHGSNPIVQLALTGLLMLLSGLPL